MSKVWKRNFSLFREIKVCYLLTSKIKLGFSVLNGNRTSICTKYFPALQGSHTKQSRGKDMKPTFKSTNHQAQSTWIKTMSIYVLFEVKITHTKRKDKATYRFTSCHPKNSSTERFYRFLNQILHFSCGMHESGPRSTSMVFTQGQADFKQHVSFSASLGN